MSSESAATPATLSDGPLNYEDHRNTLDDKFDDAKEDPCIAGKRIRGQAKIYEQVETFKNTQEACEYLKTFEKGRWQFKRDTNDKKRYSCRACGKALYFLYHDKGVTLFVEDAEHNHGEETRKNRLPLESTKRAKEMFETHSNRAIIGNLPQLTEQQLRNLKNRHNKAKYGSPTMDLNTKK